MKAQFYYDQEKVPFFKPSWLFSKYISQIGAIFPWLFLYTLFVQDIVGENV